MHYFGVASPRHPACVDPSPAPGNIKYRVSCPSYGCSWDAQLSFSACILLVKNTKGLKKTTCMHPSTPTASVPLLPTPPTLTFIRIHTHASQAGREGARRAPTEKDSDTGAGGRRRQERRNGGCRCCRQHCRWRRRRHGCAHGRGPGRGEWHY